MKALIFLAKIVVVITILNVSTFAVYNVMTNGKIFGSASPYIIQFASFPRLLKEGVSQALSEVKHFQLRVEKEFEKTNSLERNLYIATSYYEDQNSSIKINLVNLRSEDTLFQWNYVDENLLKEGFSINHPLIFKDSSVIFKTEDSFIAKLNKDSEVEWINRDLLFHHSLELDKDGNIWVPTTSNEGKENSSKYLRNLTNEALSYRDDAITKIDPVSGEILYSKSVSDILVDNNLHGLILGFWQQDPIHLNDIQPVLNDSPYWQQGDLFISCRNLHLVFLYRPSSGEIIWHLIGPWISQHDVDILDSTAILVFNNNVNLSNYNLINKTGANQGNIAESQHLYDLNTNKIVYYNFSNSSVSDTLFQKLMISEKVNTITGGRSDLIDDLLFIEETNEGKIYVANDKGVLYKSQFVSANGKFAYYPGWSRIYNFNPLFRH